MTSKSVFWRILVSFALVVVTLIAGIGSYFMVTMREQYYDMTEHHLLVQARMIAPLVLPLSLEQDWAGIHSLCQGLTELGVVRLTVILPDGRVVGDSARDAQALDNHADRPEIARALAARTWSASVRRSQTLGEDMFYVALPLESEGNVIAVVRTATPLTLLRKNYRAVQLRIATVVALILAIAVLITWLNSQAVCRPLRAMKEVAGHFANGDFNWRVPLDSPEEISALADSMNWMAAQLDKQISTVKRQQYEQQAIIASMREGIVALDNHQRIITINKAAAEIFETTVEQAANRPICEVTRHQVLTELIGQISGEQRLVESDISIYAQGSTRYLQVRATQLLSPEGQMIGVLLVLNDVTRLRRLENVRRDFVENVTHELKTPVTTIKGFVETLLDNPCEPGMLQRYLGIISSQTERLASIIENLLNLSRIEGDREHGNLPFEDTAIRPMVENAVQLCRPEADRKEIAIELDCPEELTFSLNADLIEQALVNLINNAIRYSSGQTRITVRVTRSDEGIQLAVADQGMGISPEHQPRIFERFYRVDKNRSRKLGGTGLGLAIVKHIAKAHHGRVETQSEPGHGSVFTIHLPVQRAEKA